MSSHRAPGATAVFPNQMSVNDPVVVDVDTGKPLESKKGREGRIAQLREPIAGADQSARLQLTGTITESIRRRGRPVQLGRTH